MWFEDRSLSNMKVSSLIVEEWRDIWSSKPEFMFAALAYLFATTNFLNLPRLILDYGGPAFIVAYGTVLLVLTLPIIVLELTIGQLTGRAPVQAFYNICPVFKGVGIAQIIFSLIVLATMTRYLAWILLFIYHLFWTLNDNRPGLPWLQCKYYPEFQFGDCHESATIFSTNTSLYTVQSKLAIFHEDSAMSQFTNVLDNASESIAKIGGFQLHFLIAQGIVWALVFCAICFGVRWLGKVMVFSFLVPIILLIGLCARAQFLDGAIEMFEYIFVDMLDWHRLKDIMLWKTAAEQAIMATGVGFGAFILLGSFNKRCNNLVQDSFVLLIGHALISILQFSTVFGLVGFISSKTSLTPNELVDQGENQFLTLLVYLAYIPHNKIFTGMLLVMFAFAILNIFYLLSLCLLATLEDALGEKWSRCFPRFCLAIFVCLFGMAISLIFATQTGKHAYELATGYLKYTTLVIILAFELFTAAWIYCAHSLGMDLKSMLRSTCCWCLGHFLLFFTYLLPAVPIAIATVNLMGYSFAKYSEEIRNWPWSELVGISIALLPLLPIPLCAFCTICHSCMRGTRLSHCRRFCLAFRSPIRYEILKGSMSSAAYHRNENHHQPHHFSPRYNAGASTGYVLLPQTPAAPLAQPENDDGVTGGLTVDGPRRVNNTNTSSSTIRADSASAGGHAEGAFV